MTNVAGMRRSVGRPEANRRDRRLVLLSTAVILWPASPHVAR